MRKDRARGICKNDDKQYRRWWGYQAHNGQWLYENMAVKSRLYDKSELDSEGEWSRMRIAIAGKTQSRKYAQKKNTLRPVGRTYNNYQR